MKKPSAFLSLSSLLILCLFLSTNAYTQAGDYRYDDAWGEQGLQVLDQRSSELILTYSITEFQIVNQLINGEPLQEVLLPAHFLPNEAGAPNLPGNGQFLAIPNGATAHVEILRSRTEIIENVSVAPAPLIPFDNDDNPLDYTKKAAIYGANAFYPEQAVTLSHEKELRGVNMVMLGITPYQYNPVSKQLKVWRDIEIRIVIEGGNGTYGTERLRSRWWDPIIKSAILNYQVLPEMDYAKQSSTNQRSNEYEYLIICPNGEAFTNWADTIRRFRTMQGIKTGVVTVGEIGANDPVVIENYIDQIYASWETPPAAVLILGDYGSSASNTVTSPIYNNYCVADNIYADVNDDHMPDIVFARITAQNDAQLEVMVRKFIEYETNPPTSYDFYQHPITALGWQTERWFQICSETVGGYWKNELGKDPVRINEVYGGNPLVDPWSYAPNTATVLNYFGPNGLGYIPATPDELGNWSGGTASDINNAINDGAFMLQHRDHGNEGGWGEPAYNRSSINGLTNTDLTFVFSINCLTGKYNNSSEVFAEKFHRYTYQGNLSGALGLNAPSEVSYSFVNDTYVWGLYDYMWPDFMPDYGGNFPEQRGILPGFAMAYAKIFLEHSGWPYNTGNKEVTYNLFHHHGDAFLNVYTEVPQELSVDHNNQLTSGAPTFELSADEGALICLSVSGEIIAVAEGTGSTMDLPIGFVEPGSLVDVVVTKQNYFRYHQQVLAIPPSGPYLLNVSHVLNDAMGNNNGEADYDESLLLSVTLKNVGIEVAAGITVSISCPDPYITLTDSEQMIDQINPDESHSLTDAFSFSIADDIPDQYPVQLEVLASSGENSWSSIIEFVVNAPALSIEGFQMLELTGNMNGIIDPGETARLECVLVNNGHCSAAGVLSTLSTENNYLSMIDGTEEYPLLANGASVTSSFTFEVNGHCPIGEEVGLLNINLSGGYNCSQPIYLKVGSFVEDWETGNLLKYNWINQSDKAWHIVTDEVYEGTYALRSGAMDPGDFCMLNLAYESYADDSISFFKKTSTEEAKGTLIFIIDGVPKGNWTGEEDWSRVVFPLPAGKHNFSWTFMYDAESDITQNCVWVDLIMLPQNPSTIVWAGDDEVICNNNNSLQLQGFATYYEDIEWSTSGTGNFSPVGDLNAIYDATAADMEMEFVQLTLSVHSSSGNILSNEMKLHFLPIPEPAEIFTQIDTVMPVYNANTELTAATALYATDYMWSLEPEDAGSISHQANTASIEWNSSFSGDATIRYCGINNCGYGSITEKVIVVVDALGIAENETFPHFSVFPNPSNGLFNINFQLSQQADVSVDISNTSAVIVWEKSYSNVQQVDEALSLSGLPKGLYFITLRSSQNKFLRKLVIR